MRFLRRQQGRVATGHDGVDGDGLLGAEAVEVMRSAGMLRFAEVLPDCTTPHVFKAFKATVQVRPEIMECHMVAGGFDYLLRTRMADMAAYRDFAGTLLGNCPACARRAPMR